MLPEKNQDFGPSEVARLVAAGMLLLAPLHWPYGYYTLLRLVVCGVAGYSAYVALASDRVGLAWVLGGIALIFNPIIPIHLSREIWSVFNVVVAVTFCATFAAKGRFAFSPTEEDS